jgi:hypothetical protein
MEKKSLFFLLIIVIFLSFLFYLIAVEIQYKKKGIAILHGADPMYYFSYVRSILIDGDLNLKNEYEYFKIKEPLSPTGLPVNKYPIGFPLLILPFFALTHLVIIFLNFLGFKIPPTGYSLPYQLSFCFGSIFYGYLGLFISYKILKKFFTPLISFLAVIFFLFASNLVYYFLKGPYYSHLTAFFMASAFIFLWLTTEEKANDLFKFFLFGIAGGLLVMIRLQDVVFFTLPFLSFLFTKKRKLLNISLFLLGAFLVFTIQMIVWKIIFGSYLVYSYGNEKFIYWSSPKIFQVLFATRHGLILFHPIILFSLIGLFLLEKEKLFLGLSFFILFLFQLYLISSWHCWWFGYSFGHRGFLSCAPIFIFGLASFLNYFQKRSLLKFVSLFLILLVIGNGVMMLAYLTEIIPPDDYFRWHNFLKELPKIQKLVLRNLFHY